MTQKQKQVFEKAKNDVIDGILRYFGKNTIGLKGDICLNELRLSSVDNIIPEQEQEMQIQKIWNLTEDNISQEGMKVIESYLLPRILSKIIPTKEKREYLVSYEDEKEIREEYADFLQKGFTEYLSKEYADDEKNQLPYKVTENHVENYNFAKEVIEAMKVLPRDFSTRIHTSLFAYNVDQIENQLSSLSSEKDFYKTFKTEYLNKEKIEKLKRIIEEDFDEAKQAKILREIQRHKKVEYAELTLQKVYLEGYKEQLPLVEEKMNRIKEILKGSTTSTSQSKSNGNTRVLLPKTGSIKGLFIFVFSILFALLIAYFMNK